MTDIVSALKRLGNFLCQSLVAFLTLRSLTGKTWTNRASHSAGCLLSRELKESAISAQIRAFSSDWDGL